MDGIYPTQRLLALVSSNQSDGDENMHYGQDLSEQDLSEIDLRSENLVNANLTQSKLINTTLSDMNLTDVDFSWSDLIGANLSGTNLRGACFRAANLSNVNLRNASLIDVNLRGAQMKGTILAGIELSNLNLTPKQISEANLTDALFNGEKITPEKLKEIILNMLKEGANDLRGVDLSGVNLSGMNLFGKDFCGANLSGVNLTGSKLTLAILNKVNLTNANLNDANLCDAKLNYSNLVNAKLCGAILNSATLICADLSGSDISNAILKRTDLKNANLNNSNLVEVDLSYANLCGANLNRASLIGADLTNAIFDDDAQIILSFPNWAGDTFDLLEEYLNHLLSQYGSSLLTAIDSIDSQYDKLKISLMHQVIHSLADIDISSVKDAFVDILCSDPIYEEDEIIKSFIEERSLVSRIWYVTAIDKIHNFEQEWEKLEKVDGFNTFETLLNRLTEPCLRNSVMMDEIVVVISSVIHSSELCRLVFDEAQGADANCHDRPLTIFNTIQSLVKFGQLVRNRDGNIVQRELLELAMGIVRQNLLDEAVVYVMQNQWKENRRTSNQEGTGPNTSEALEVQLALRHQLASQLSLPFPVNNPLNTNSTITGLNDLDREFAIDYVSNRMANKEQMLYALISLPVWKLYMGKILKNEVDQIISSYKSKMAQFDEQYELLPQTDENYLTGANQLMRQRQHAIDALYREETEKLVSLLN